jgi:signal transduction histidine kinase/ligand-binding sensor domain-containing protein/DNA-binding response OmpR family regulator
MDKVFLFLYRCLFALLLLPTLLYCSSFGENGNTPGKYLVKSWTTDNGLPQNTVNKIVQTRDGYIWLATNYGLVRFDGIEFNVYDTQNFPLMQTNRILDMIESKEGSLWIGTEGEGVVVKRKNNRNSVYKTEDGLSGNIVLSLFEDSEERMWIVTNKGLNYYKDGRIHSFTTTNGLSNNLVYRIFEDSRHNLWIAARDDVLNRFNNGKVSHIHAERGDQRAYIHTIYEDRDQNVWFSYSGRLTRFKDGTFTSVTIPLGRLDPVVSMAEDHEGNLWAVDYNGFFYHIREGIPETVPLPQLEGKYRSSLMVDREGLLWVGTGGSGLLRLRKVPLAVYSVEHGLSHHLALSIHQDEKGVVWVGTNGAGVSCFENGIFKPFEQMPGGHVWATLTDSSGYHWFGTWGGGLFRIKGGDVRNFKKSDGLPDNVVVALYEDSKRNLWIGTGNGLAVYNNGQFEDFHKRDGFKGDFVFSLLEDSRGTLWAGTKTHGLNRLENGRFTNYSIRNGLSHNSVRALYEDDTGSLWIGTYGGGLNRYKNGTFASITMEEGLYDNVVSCILEDSRGFLWMSCNRGVYRADKRELNDAADGKLNKITCTYYNKTDGMKTAECNGGFQPSGWKTADGKLWFPTIRGVVVFSPGQATVNREPPPVIIEKIIVDGNEIDLRQKGELSPGVKRFEFHYSALSFPVPDRVRFKYKLEGLGEEWHDVGTRRVAYYNQIPAGDYTFRVKACNNDGVWNETGASVSFYLKPYFFRTGWFYGLCVLAAAVLVFLGYRLRVRQLKARERELAKMVESRTMQLAEQSEKLKEMDRVKSRFFANVSHEFRTPVTLIMGALEEMLSDSTDPHQEEAVHMALRHSHRMLALINQLLDLSKLDSGKMRLRASKQDIIPFLKGVTGSFRYLLEQQKLDLSFLADGEEISLYFDPEKVEKVIGNIIANAIKYTPAGGRITLCAALRTAKTRGFPDGHLEIKISDTGTGIPEKQLPYIFDPFFQANEYFSHERKHEGTGIGLALVKDLVSLHHGDIHVTSRQGKGAEFILRLPLGKAHLEPGDIKAESPLAYTFESRSTLPEEYETPSGRREQEEDHKENDTDEQDIILVVEDNLDVRKYIHIALEEEYTVIEAADGEAGIQIAGQVIPDLIISDVMMPRKDGYQLCNVLKKDVKTSHIPIILLTAKASQESVIEGLETGADDYIIKPFNINILLARIRNLIALRRRLQEKIQREMMLQPTEIEVSSIDREFMKELKETTEKNLSDMEFGVDGLAKLLYMSRTTLNRKIKALTGESTNQFIQSYRLKRAVQLLKENFGNVTEVAFAVGFSSSNYFTRCFKEKYHRLPHTFTDSSS